jgi:molecular chaperone HscC
MTYCGIDLGTTNSLIALFDDTGPKLIPNALGEVLTPSVVGVDETGDILVGKAARERLLTHPEKTIASFKRFMGSERETHLATHSFRPEELSSLVLRSLKADAEAFLGRPVTEAVISVPAYFNDHQRKATLDAGRLAGLNVERLVNEPTAAALAYGLGQIEQGKFLVFDLGGGTFDVSILDKYEGVMEVRATAGDTCLGGDDFTAAIERIILRAAGGRIGHLEAAAAAVLRRTAENAKLQLTSMESVPFDVLLGKARVQGVLRRFDFETECGELLRRLRVPLDRAIADAVLRPNELDNVVMVGGATRMPMVRSLVARLFGRLPLIHIDPDTTVGLGAAVQAGLKARASALEDVIMTDVCPHTLGIAVVDDRGKPESRHVAPIIERNAVVPISRSSNFGTIARNQSRINIQVYQGENLRPENNVLLGALDVSVPPAEAGVEQVEVRFTYDINGVLEVEARALSTGLIEKRIFRNACGLSEEQLEQRFAALAEIKLHPREQAKNKALLTQAERVYAEQRGDAREAIREGILQFEREISDQAVRDMSKAQDAFADFLNIFERRPFDLD